MKRIDAHQHFWKFDPVRDSWINEEMATIQRDFLPADLLPHLQQHQFDGCVVVQSDQSLEENKFQLANAREFDFIKGIVGWVDLQSPQVGEQLAYYAGLPKMKGFRHVLQGEPNRALMLTPAFKRGIAMLGEFGFTYDILVFPDQLKYVADLVKTFPDQAFVLDHIAKPNIRQQQVSEWMTDIRVLGELENLYCKVSGMVTEADWQQWKPADFTSCLDTVVETFGTNRLLYGSDWPVCQVAATYEQTFKLVNDYFAAFSEQERDRIFGLNAIQFYQL